MQNKESYPTIKDFVMQEAHEKSFEILVLGLKDFEKEKSKIYEERKQIIQIELDKKMKEKIAAKRIHKSALINNSRMSKMNSRHQVLEKIVKLTEHQLFNQFISNKQQYKKLLKNLITEGLIKLLQPVVYVRCLLRDADLVKEVIEQSKSEFQNLIRNAGIDQAIGNVDLKLDQRYFLEERNVTTDSERVKKSEENSKCFGGVILTNQEGVIVCKNTLDSRLQLAYQHMLPTIRSSLFQ